MSDRKLMAVIRREYLERVRTRWFAIATLFGPFLFGGLMFVPVLLSSGNQVSANASNIEIIDATGSDLGRRLATDLAGGLAGGSKEPRVHSTLPDSLAKAESLATQAVISESARGYLVLDQGTLLSGRARYAGSNTTAIFDMQRLERSLQRQILLLRVEQAGVDPDLGRSLAASTAAITTERLTKEGRGGSGQVHFILGLAVSMVLYMTIFIYGVNVMRGVLEEKQTRVAEVVLASIPASRLLAGKVIGVGGVGLTQVTLWVIMSAALYFARGPVLSLMGISSSPFAIPAITVSTGLVLLGFFVLGFLFYAGLFAAVGATINTEQEAQQAQMPVVLLLVASVIFVQNILMQPDGSLSLVMSLLPFSAPIVMPLRMTVAPVPGLQVAAALVSVAIGAALTTWLAGRIYRVGLLMYGKRPGFREVLNWISYK